MDIVYYIMPLSDLTDWVSIGVDLVVGLMIGGVLAYFIPKRLNDSRSLKDFYISEIRDVKVEFNELCKQISIGKMNAVVMKETFKQLSIRLNDIQYSVNNHLKLDLNIVSFIESTQGFITSADEINEQYESKYLILASATKRELVKRQELFNRNVLSAIARINDVG
ncbi:MAG: hypothetical protein IJY95_01270 [Bacteroides sp.]|nr:hypothetical protein [Bacteroides sp.]